MESGACQLGTPGQPLPSTKVGRRHAPVVILLAGKYSCADVPVRDLGAAHIHLVTVAQQDNSVAYKPKRDPENVRIS